MNHSKFSGFCLNLNAIQFCHFLGLAMLSSHLLETYGSLCSGKELTLCFRKLQVKVLWWFDMVDG